MSFWKPRKTGTQMNTPIPQRLSVTEQEKLALAQAVALAKTLAPSVVEKKTVLGLDACIRINDEKHSVIQKPVLVLVNLYDTGDPMYRTLSLHKAYGFDSINEAILNVESCIQKTLGS